MLTGEEYRASLEDGREVYFDGERVDVGTHDIFKRAITVAVAGYNRFYDPASGAISSYLRTPTSIEEMRTHADLKVDPLSSTSYSSLMTRLTSADRIAELRPEGSAAIRNYVKEVQEKDLRVVECITDAKGDRGKRPSGYAGHHAVSTIQAGGGLFAQRVVTRSRYHMAKARQMALDKAGLDDPWA